MKKTTTNATWPKSNNFSHISIQLKIKVASKQKAVCRTQV